MTEYMTVDLRRYYFALRQDVKWFRKYGGEEFPGPSNRRTKKAVQAENVLLGQMCDNCFYASEKNTQNNPTENKCFVTVPNQRLAKMKTCKHWKQIEGRLI